METLTVISPGNEIYTRHLKKKKKMSVFLFPSIVEKDFLSPVCHSCHYKLHAEC